MKKAIGRHTPAILFLAVAFVVGCSKSVNQHGGQMDPQTLEVIIRGNSDNFERDGNVFQFDYLDVTMACVFDSEHDRMRIITPIIEEQDLSEAQLQILLEANFHAALDARYATSDGILYGAYIHPLSPLTEDEVLSAMRQVAGVANNFGSTYSSGELFFGSPGGTEQ